MNEKELLDLLATERDRFGKLETEMKKELAEKDRTIQRLEDAISVSDAFAKECLHDLEAERAAAEKLAAAANGLSFGEDWNDGTHAKLHGYRQKLLYALAAYHEQREYRNRHKGEQ